MKKAVITSLCAWYFLIAGNEQLKVMGPYTTETVCWKAYGSLDWPIYNLGYRFGSCYSDQEPE